MIIGISGKIGSGKDTLGAIIKCLTCNDENMHETELIKSIAEEPEEGLES